jgi:hypothetical protein
VLTRAVLLQQSQGSRVAVAEDTLSACRDNARDGLKVRKKLSLIVDQPPQFNSAVLS